MDKGDELVGGVLMTGMVGYDMAFWRDKCVTGIVQRREEACVYMSLVWNCNIPACFFFLSNVPEMHRQRFV
jgi:hypothetical protein